MALGSHAFAGLRRYARAVLSPLLAALVVGSIGAAGPCVGMAVERAETATAHETHARAHAGHAAATGAPGARAASGDPHEGHGRCPHCPGSAGAISGHHACCAALDDVEDGTHPPGVAALDFKPQPPLLAAAAVLPRFEPAAPRRLDRHRRVPAPSVPLNLRHCVLIV